MATNPFVSAPADCALDASGWLELGDGRAISRLPVQDLAAELWARLGHGPAGAWLESQGMRLPTVEEYEALHRAALHIDPYTLPTVEMLDAAGIPKPRMLASGADTAPMAHYRAANIRSRAWCELHDAEVQRRLEAAGWHGEPVANAGKHWSQYGVIVGWWKRGGGRIQNPSAFHRADPTYTDYATTFHAVVDRSERPTRPELPPPPSMPPASKPAHSDADGASEAGGVLSPVDTRTVRRGDTGPAVLHVQGIVGAKRDGVFGPATDAAVKTWQAEHGLVADGVFGAKSWTAAGFPMPPPPKAKDPRAPACVAALRDATARFPTRKRASDGIMGDASHQASKSDHNRGMAYDCTHDPESGCDGHALSEMAITDRRAKYVIWNRRIWSRARAGEGWRPYSGSNGHTHHVHVSVLDEYRNDDSKWPWAPRP